MMSLRPIFLSGILALCGTQAAAQVTLNFDNLVLTDYAPIPQTYGDNLAPNIPDIAYRTFALNTGITIEDHLEFWNNDYGDLSKVAFASQNGGVAEIAFTPAAGYAINLISFEMAGYPHVNKTNSYMRLVDASNNIVFDFAANGPVPIAGVTTGTQHTTFTPDITFNGTLKLQWGTDWNVGIDNIKFQAVAVPEPSTFLLIGAGAAGLLLQGWRRRRTRATQRTDT